METQSSSQMSKIKRNGNLHLYKEAFLFFDHD